MATANLSELVTRLGGPASPDDDLLARFAASRDEAAFAELVRRHGGTVFGVCRRVTGNHHLAEDAFQAVFVVLAAKAASLRPRSAVAAWLHGVAFRTSLRARTMADRRRRREPTVETLPEVAVVPPEPCDAVALLDEAIAELPESLRLPVVLCELEGGSRAAVARTLGIPEGTLSSRLASARKALAGRLRNRGVVLSAAGLTLALGQVASASVPAGLAARAVAAATSPGCVPAAVADLTSGVVRLMFLNKLKTAAPLAGLFALAVCAGGLVAGSAPPAAAPAPVKRQAAAKAAAGPNTLLAYRAGRLVLIDPDGKKEKALTAKDEVVFSAFALLSPDGKTFAQSVFDPPVTREEVASGKVRRPQIHVRGLDAPHPGVNLGVEGHFAWSGDGTEIVAGTVTRTADKLEYKYAVVNVATKKATPLVLPEGHELVDWAADGRFLTAAFGKGDEKTPVSRLYLVNRDGTGPKSVAAEDEYVQGGRVSPDGKRVLCAQVQLDLERGGEPKRRLAVAEVATGKVTPVPDAPLDGYIVSSCWSPDGKKIAYTWRNADVRAAEGESFLMVCDADGKNAKTVLSEKGGMAALILTDWR